jgi:hypothetical protein
MSVVIVGGDYLGGIEKNLYSLGVKELVHISGRKAFDRNKISLPEATAFVLVLTDYVNHATAGTLRRSPDPGRSRWCSPNGPGGRSRKN